MKLEDAIKTAKFTSEKQKASLNILYTAWWLKTIMTKEFKALSLTQEQFNVLRILKGKHPQKMCVKDIGCRMIERNSNVPRIIDRLVAKKFVDRSTSAMDKRETVITLTQAGINVLETASYKVESIITASFSIEEDDAKQLNTLLEMMREKE